MPDLNVPGAIGRLRFLQSRRDIVKLAFWTDGHGIGACEERALEERLQRRLEARRAGSSEKGFLVCGMVGGLRSPGK